MKVDIQIPEDIGQQLQREWRAGWELVGDCHFGPLKLSLSSITPISTTALRISNKIERRLSALFSDDRRFGYDGIKRFFSILLDTAGMFAEWERIVIHFSPAKEMDRITSRSETEVPQMKRP